MSIKTRFSHAYLVNTTRCVTFIIQRETKRGFRNEVKRETEVYMYSTSAKHCNIDSRVRAALVDRANCQRLPCILGARRQRKVTKITLYPLASWSCSFLYSRLDGYLCGPCSIIQPWSVKTRKNINSVGGSWSYLIITTRIICLFILCYIWDMTLKVLVPAGIQDGFEQKMA